MSQILRQGTDDRTKYDVATTKRLIVLALAAVAAVGCSIGATPERLSGVALWRNPTSSTTAPPPVTVVATAQVPSLDVFNSPGDAAPAQSLPNPRPLGGPLVLVVTGQQGPWLQAELPVRPNGSVGWIRSSDVSLSHHDFRIFVSLPQHSITVYEGYTMIDNEPVGIGEDATPTPGGTYYTADFVKLADPSGPYGPFAYGLSGYSDVLTSFGGGPGQLAIHGTNDPSGLGTNVSHGCIRMSNDGITRLSGVLPLGVPVIVLGSA